MATPKPPTTPAADFSAMEGQGLENLGPGDRPGPEPEWLLYWRIWDRDEHGIPLALFKAWRACRKAGVAVPAHMQAAVDKELESLFEADSAEAIAARITDTRHTEYGTRRQLEKLQRDDLLACLSSLLAMPRDVRASDNDIYKAVAVAYGKTAGAVEKLWRDEQKRLVEQKRRDPSGRVQQGE